MISDFFQFNLPTKIIFQAGISKDFSNELGSFGISSLLIITDKFLFDSGLINPIVEGIKNSGIEKIVIFSEVPPNSEIKIVQKAADLGKSIDADGILAIGGGSVMDTAKAANILLSMGGDLVNDYSGAQTLTAPLKPLIAIPTTAGTGSEVTKVAVILDEEKEVKLSFVDRFLVPNLAVLDPELTLSLPPKLTAMTGMDALTHAIEAFTSLEKNPFSDGLAMKAIQLVFDYLPLAVKEGKNLQARSALLTASNMAGVAFDHAMVGVVHSMSHATGAISHVPHGLANSILLPWGMEYNFEVAKENYAALALPLKINVSSLSIDEQAKAVIQKVVSLRQELKTICDLPDRLKDAQVKESDLSKIAGLAVEDGSSFYNPREVVEEEILKTLQKAY